MKFSKTEINDVYIINIDIKNDERGYFVRTYCKKEFAKRDISMNMKQANMAYNKNKYTLRGLHYQKAPYSEKKLIRCVRGCLWDVIIDLRPESSTFRQWMGLELRDDIPVMLYVPDGCAHGYQTITDDTEVLYMVSEFYSPEFERGIRFNDPAFNISWKSTDNIVISDKDKNWPDFSG